MLVILFSCLHFACLRNRVYRVWCASNWCCVGNLFGKEVTSSASGSFQIQQAGSSPEIIGSQTAIPGYYVVGSGVQAGVQVSSQSQSQQKNLHDSDLRRTLGHNCGLVRDVCTGCCLACQLVRRDELGQSKINWAQLCRVFFCLLGLGLLVLLILIIYYVVVVLPDAKFDR